MVVRDPLIRLVSAYLDKLTTPYRFSRLGKKLKTKWSLSEEHAYTFTELLSAIEQDLPELHMDQHFEKIINLCNPCDIKYDFIATQETLTEDAEYLIREIFKSTLDVSDVFVASIGPRSADMHHISTTDFAREVNNNALLQYKIAVRDYVANDSHLFGYDVNQWLHL